MAGTEVADDGLQGASDRFIRKFADDAVELSAKFGLPDGFLVDLLSEQSDWSFCIKLHTVLETALKQAILKAVFNTQWARPRDDVKLERFCTALSFEGRTGKLGLAETFGLVGDETLKSLRAVNRLRNLFAHDVSMVGKSLQQAAAADDDPKLLDKACRIGLTENMRDPLVRFYFLVAGVYNLWEIDFRTQPPPTILTSFYAGTRDEDPAQN